IRPAHGAAPRKASSPEASILSAASAGRGGTCGPSPASATSVQTLRRKVPSRSRVTASTRMPPRSVPIGGMLQRPCNDPKRAHEPEPDEARQRGEAPVQDAELEAGPEQGVARRAIALDQEVEVCGLAEREFLRALRTDNPGAERAFENRR